MAYTLRIPESSVYGKKKFVNKKGNTECVEFVQQATGAPATLTWRKGIKVKGASVGAIPRGTAIATFDVNGSYPTDTHGRHAAIYISHDQQGVKVLDQWNSQGEVQIRTIHFNPPKVTKRSNDGDTFYVIE